MTDAPSISNADLAEARAAAEAAYAAVVAYIPADAMERCEALCKADPKAGRIAFSSLQYLYVPMPEHGRLATTLNAYHRIKRSAK